MDPLVITLTKAGFAAIIADDGPGFTAVEIAQIGLTATAFTAASTLELLPGEFKRLDVSGEQSGDDIIHVVALDDSSDAYAYRGFGLYLADGTLFGTYGQSDPIAGKAPASTTYLVIDIQLADGMAGAISFGDTNFLNPPATTTRKGVVELATNTETAAGADTQRAVTPAALQAALLTLLLRVDGPDTGINADLLDGLHAAAFVLAQDETTFGSNANGYWRKMPNGLIEQWGELTAGESASPPSQTFPIPFTDLASINLSVTARTPNPGAVSGNSCGGNKVSITQFNVFSDDLDRAVFWRALGK